jgi:hypothetical protein
MMEMIKIMGARDMNKNHLASWPKKPRSPVLKEDIKQQFFWLLKSMTIINCKL